LNSAVSKEPRLTPRLAKARRTAAHYLTQPVVQLLTRTSITPNTVTWGGFLLTVGAAVLIATGHLLTAGFIVLIAGFFDMVDGALARQTDQTTRFGGILDSTLDRLAEATLLLSILFIYAGEQSVGGVLLVSATLVSSLMVSYIRARAEALGSACQVGLFTRPERVIVLALGLLLSQFAYALVIALATIAIFSFITVGQRLLYVRQQIKN
jgi:CDP-diacylglycerol--glycerol-3-phosphate 3-phosphatidyltransferase